MKRIISTILTILTVLSVFVIPASAAGKTKLAINLTNPTKSVTINQGSSLGIHGTVTAKQGKKLTEVSGYIVKKAKVLLYAKKSEQKKTVNPNAASFKLDNSVINSGLKFNTLQPGDYYLVIKAKDTSKLSVTKKVKVSVKKPVSTLKITLTAPINQSSVTIKQGSSLGIHGKVECTGSGNVITKVTGTLGSYSKTCTPNTTTFDIGSSVINSGIITNNLNAGTYILKIEAWDKFGNNTSKTVTIVVENPPSNTWNWPLRVSSYITGLDVYGVHGGEHWGIDIPASAGTSVYAVCAGTVLSSGWDNSFGNYVKIKHTVNGKTYTSLYAHLSSRAVSTGTVTTDTIIGKVGDTGDSNGNHLHLEIFEGTSRSRNLSKHTFEYYANNISLLKQYVKYFSGIKYENGMYKSWFTQNCYKSGGNFYLN